MQIILMEKVVNLGQLGDVVKVKNGYARNFLIPQGKAKRATPTAIAPTINMTVADNESVSATVAVAPSAICRVPNTARKA